MSDVVREERLGGGIRLEADVVLVLLLGVISLALGVASEVLEGRRGFRVHSQR
ncbi:MAG: hypothetical protein F7B17_09265 [Desulfurococcales archaeon]|nr:hypothetical protein [Desulfurococcales archaeon]